jgi:hypothetical protein
MDTTIKETMARQATDGGERALSQPPARTRIEGWGADLDHANRPAYPMERRPPRLEAHPVPRPVDQQHRHEVLHSIERPGLTPVYGTTVPPRGLSGAMRRLAFRYSENDLRHWLVLLAADRVNMVEGIASDLARGHVPNLYREMGGPAELRHNPRGAARKAMVLGALAGVAWWAWRRRASRR